ncbi:phage integrase [Pseudoduganella sp. S-14]|uniref:phage integrase n=1 Tax=Pseudoduganella sp. S-14 TaxID=3404065 RepID=UPI003CF42F97
MAIKKSEGGWLVDSQPAGRGGKRYRKTFKTQAEAKAWEAWLKTQVNKQAEWAPEKRDRRKLSDLVDMWFEHHGVGLRSGKDTYARLKSLCVAMGNPMAEAFNAAMFSEYRAKRLASGISANNLNREHAYLRSVFNELGRLGHWLKDNPLAKLRQFKIVERELSYLSLNQVSELLTTLGCSRNPHVMLISKICLATGARWSEVEDLRISQVREEMIQYARTKSGKVRAVPISSELEEQIRVHFDKHGDMERVFGTAFTAFREGIERTTIALPDGQLTHALRHTFASHFMMNGGNILTLQRILGHANLTMTMRYAHLAPEHLQEAKALNPIALLTVG